MMLNGKVYKVTNTIDEFVYIGSTTQGKISSRMCQRRTNSKGMQRQSKLYCHMRKLGVDKFKIHVLLRIQCHDRKELEALEFEEMQKVPRELLLNEDTQYKHKSEEHNRKVGDAQLADKSHNWKFGSVFRREGVDSEGFPFEAWCFAYKDPQTQKQKRHQFSIKKYGNELANKKAKDKQLDVFPKFAEKY